MWNKPHHYRGYVCPHCGAPVTFCRLSARIYKFLFWYFEVPKPTWIAYCDDWCDGFMADKVYAVSPTLRERKREWRKYYSLTNTKFTITNP